MENKEWERLEQFLDLPVEEKTKQKCFFKIEVNNSTKDQRTEIHKTIKSSLQGFLSETAEEFGKKFIRFYFSKKPDKRNSEQFLSFVLRKRNWDTMQALNKIAKSLKKRTGDFFFAGTKDKRGETIQRVVAKHLTKEELASLVKNQYWKWEEVSFCSLKYTEYLIKIGDLSGNRFTIALRLLEDPKEGVINDNCQSVLENGFVNFYGLQRFGSKDKVI